MEVYELRSFPDGRAWAIRRCRGEDRPEGAEAVRVQRQHRVWMFSMSRVFAVSTNY